MIYTHWYLKIIFKLERIFRRVTVQKKILK